MRSLSDCIGDMLGARTEDQEIEALLSGRGGNGPDGLAVLFGAFDLDRLNVSVEDKAEEFAAIASRLVDRSAPSLPTRSARTRMVPRLATAALTAVLVMGFAGAAVAADSARPGDALYGLDRALEWIGINDGGLDERLEEAQSLADDGLTDEALDLLADEIEGFSPNAAAALAAAAERLDARDNPSAAREGVAAMLKWMSETPDSGREFGQGVADLARGIGAGQGGDNPDAGPPEDVGNKPEDPGNNPGTVPDKAQKPEDGQVDQDVTTTDSNSDDSSNTSNQGQGSGQDRGNDGGGNSGGGGPPGGKPGKRGP
jgi:uncharacterized membrane protein YgcG